MEEQENVCLLLLDESVVAHLASVLLNKIYGGKSIFVARQHSNWGLVRKLEADWPKGGPS